MTSYELGAIACHPSELCVATGNQRGQIELWWGWNHRKKDPVTTLLHWHAHAVSDLCFTSDGEKQVPLLVTCLHSPPLFISPPFHSLPPSPPPCLSLLRYLLTLWWRGMCLSSMAAVLVQEPLSTETRCTDHTNSM